MTMSPRQDRYVSIWNRKSGANTNSDTSYLTSPNSMPILHNREDYDPLELLKDQGRSGPDIVNSLVIDRFSPCAASPLGFVRW